MTRNYLPGRWELAPFGRDFFGSADFSGGREREYQEYSVIFAK